ncbi:MAG: acyltransferase [Anaerolineales bacterium]
MITRRLLFLNGLAAIGVILNHAAAWGFVAMFWWAHRYLPVSSPNFDQMGGASYYALRFIEQLIAFSIPAFLFVSGYFVSFSARGSTNRINLTFVWDRVKYIVVPYLVWALLTILADAIQGTSFTALEVVRSLILGQAAPAFYFVPLLVQLYSLSPILVRWAKRSWPTLVGIAGAMQVVAHLIRYARVFSLGSSIPDPIQLIGAGWFFPGNIAWFVLGIVIGLYIDRFGPFLTRIRWSMLVATVLLLPLGIAEWEFLLHTSGQAWIAPMETLVDNAYSLTLLLAFFGFTWLPTWASKPIGALGSKSYGIYLVHSIVLVVVARIVYHVLPGLLGWQLAFQAVLIAAGLGVPLALMWVVRASPARRLYPILFG